MVFLEIANLEEEDIEKYKMHYGKLKRNIKHSSRKRDDRNRIIFPKRWNAVAVRSACRRQVVEFYGNEFRCDFR